MGSNWDGLNTDPCGVRSSDSRGCSLLYTTATLRLGVLRDMDWLLCGTGISICNRFEPSATSIETNDVLGSISFPLSSVGLSRGRLCPKIEQHHVDS